MPNTTEQIHELELVVDETKNLEVQDNEVRNLITQLQPIAAFIAEAKQYADTVVVANQKDALEAAEWREKMIESCKKAKDAINGFQGGIIDRLFKLHRRWTAFRGLFDSLESSAKILKGKIIAWQQAEEQKAAEEQRRLQAEAEERARKERERLEKEAAKLKTPELREARLEAAATIVAPVITVSAPTKAVKSQKRWKVKSVDMTAMGIPREIQGYVEVKITNLERAKAANTMLEVPGVEFHQVAV